ncbi:hypothetical protein RSOL_530190 [Rhizoctonia solani AG-3 Rhs1AP]|uniref:Uncharacterized protein n=1 Tax=Rhizoctonia solani AG-3 Rhs1AP TaxID=1086054 RepID=X8JX67_9AGAM|nr:hypothetical protein RSOL_530190 [Rhizoctonia solani AG-3 Rhs1AP]
MHQAMISLEHFAACMQFAFLSVVDGSHSQWVLMVNHCKKLLLVKLDQEFLSS